MQRQALTVALLGVGAVAAGTLVLLLVTDFAARPASSSRPPPRSPPSGLSTGITPGLPAAAQLILVALMFVGRVGTDHGRLRARPARPAPPLPLPEERPIVG